MGTASGTATAPAGQTPIDWSASAARDRLSSTVFLAALFHGIVILGVTFSVPEMPFTPATSLDVVIVTREDSRAMAPEHATALARQNLNGSGNTDTANQLRTAVARTADAPAIGPDRPGTAETRPAGSENPRQATLVASLSGDRPAPAPSESGEPVASEQRAAMPGVIQAVEVVNEPDARTLITANGPRELVVSATTRESRIAGYLGEWKTKVERIGTLNFPRQVRARQFSGNPTLEVAIGADGRLREVLVRNSSGERLLDEAAMEILRLASPFEPFPDFLQNDYDVLRFAYEWRFGDESGVGKLMVASEH